MSQQQKICQKCNGDGYYYVIKKRWCSQCAGSRHGPVWYSACKKCRIGYKWTGIEVYKERKICGTCHEPDTGNVFVNGYIFDEILCEIFEFVPIREIYVVLSRVCKHWDRICRKEFRYIIKNIYNLRLNKKILITWDFIRNCEEISKSGCRDISFEEVDQKMKHIQGFAWNYHENVNCLTMCLYYLTDEGLYYSTGTTTTFDDNHSNKPILYKVYVSYNKYLEFRQMNNKDKIARLSPIVDVKNNSEIYVKCEKLTTKNFIEICFSVYIHKSYFEIKKRKHKKKMREYERTCIY